MVKYISFMLVLSMVACHKPYEKKEKVVDQSKSSSGTLRSGSKESRNFFERLSCHFGSAICVG